MADNDKSFYDKFKAAFEEPPKSNQPDRRPLDKDKAAGFMKGFSGESKEASGPMQRRMDKLKGGGY